MTPTTPPGDREDLLARLGLPADASDAAVRKAVAAALDDPVDAPAAPGNRRPLYVALGLLAAAVVVVGVYQWGAPPPPAPAPSTPPAGQQAPAASRTPDADRIAALRAKLATNPSDVAVLAELGHVYSVGGDAAQAKEWHAKALAIQPDNTDVLLAYGVDLFNLQDTAGAIAQWTRVTQLKPKDAEAWYNLGFAYLQAEPPDAAMSDAAWQKVIELAPDSDLAKTVRNHLPGAAPTASPTPSR